jgi:ABC-type polysaccharide/polyol phosphate export permease/cytochrome c-type biogenesis protein CcmH/NrfG
MMEGRAAEELAKATADVERDPNSPDARRRLGVAAATLRRFDLAAAAFEAWSRLEPGAPAALLARARVLSLSRDHKGAQEAGRAVLALDPAQPRALRMMARLALASGNLAQGQAFLKRAVLARPGSPVLQALLAETLLRRGLLAPAADTARAALGLDPSSGAALSVLVRSYLVRGQLLKAQAALKRFEGACADPLILKPLRDELAVKLERRAAKPDEAPPETRPEPLRVVTSDAPPPAPFPPDPPREEPSTAPSRFKEIRPTTEGLDIFDHMAIIRALILRNLRLKYRDNSLGFLLEFVRPTAVVVAHYYIFLLLKKPMPGEIPIAIFVLAGFPVWFAFNGAAQGAEGANAPGRTILIPGVTTLHLQLARAIWAWWVDLVFCLAGAVLLNIYGAKLPLPNIEMTLLIFILSGTMGFGFGMLAEQLGEILPVTKIVEKLLSWALFITSGMYYSVANTNAQLARYFLFNPLLHLVEFERNAFDPGYPVGLVNLTYPATFAFALLALGLALLAMKNSRGAVPA